VAAAPVPGADIERVWSATGWVINTVVAKYSDHLPLYRQSAILERERASRSAGRRWTMGDAVGKLLIRSRRRCAGTYSRRYIQADETTWMCRCTMEGAKPSGLLMAIRQKPGGGAVFEFGWGRGGRTKEFLGQFEAFADDGLCRPMNSRGGPKMVHSRLLGARAQEVL